MVFKFRLLSDEVDNFSREIAISSEASFLDLHHAILKSVGYSADQMTSFFICNDDWEKETEVTLIEMDSSPEMDSWIMETTKLDELIEDEGQKLLYIFDYLTERSFFIEAFEIVSGKDLDKPRLLLSEGEAPEQILDFDESMDTSASKLSMDENFYGDQDFDIDELDAEGFTGLDEVSDSSNFSTEL
jgi:hypothetical protein